jgi:hypothetical protein
LTDIVSKILSIILAFVLLAICPITIAAMTEDMTARRSVLNEVQSFIDQVIDTKTCTKEQLSDLQLGVASHGLLADVTVSKYRPVTNPDPENPGGTYTRYVKSDDTSSWETGDLCKVSVKQIGENGRQKFVTRIVSLSLPKLDFELAGRVR